MIYGYIRVSDNHPKINRQLTMMKQFGLTPEMIFTDYDWGTNHNRPAYQKLISRLKEKDLVVIKSIDRLGDNYDQIIEAWTLITKTIFADILVLDLPLLDTRNKISGLGISDIVLQVLSFALEQERLKQTFLGCISDFKGKDNFKIKIF